jgi:hypothetical protein
MTQQLSVSGTLSPDASTANTGPPAGEFGGKDYWEWDAGGETWYLHVVGIVGMQRWAITSRLALAHAVEHGDRTWLHLGEFEDGPAGEYESGLETTGVATVAEVPPEPEKLLVLEWHVGPHAGKYTLLREDL